MRGTPIDLRTWQKLARLACYRARDLARHCARSPRQLERIFHQQFSSTPQKWLDEQRLIAARELLSSGEPLKNIAAELGFKQTSHFCRKFKALHKVTPSNFALSCLVTGEMSLTDNKCRSGITSEP